MIISAAAAAADIIEKCHAGKITQMVVSDQKTANFRKERGREIGEDEGEIVLQLLILF